MTMTKRPYNSLRAKRRQFGERPLWAALMVDAEADRVRPLPAWVLLKESPVEGVTASGLLIARPLTSNTVYGEIRAIHGDTGRELGLRVGDVVAFREWAGGRWNFAGEVLLLIGKEHILAKVVDDGPVSEVA